MSARPVPTDSVRFVKELYPRLRPSDEAIARYQDVLADLPPIVIARDGILVDGYHRWQAHLRAGAHEIAAEHLGDLADVEILNESIRRNARHGQQLSRDDKRKLAERLWPTLVGEKDRTAYLANLLAVSTSKINEWTQDIRQAEQDRQRAEAYDRWLNCETQEQIAAAVGVTQKTISNWLSNLASSGEITKPPDPHMAFDIWTYGSYDGDNSRFGKLHPGVVENLLWLFTEPGEIVVDPFAGAGTVIDVAKAMGRRVWASDRVSAVEYQHLPIHTHDITTGWPDDAPARADLIILDPPYWKQAAGRYSPDAADLANMTLDEFVAAWSAIVKTCSDHLAKRGRLAFLVSPAQDGTLAEGSVVDLAHLMYRACDDAGLICERRIIVPYSTQQATGQQVDAAREHRKLLKLYRDLVVMHR